MTKYQGVSELEVLEDAVNYNKWIAERISKNLQSPALEIGSGIGNISRHITHAFHVTLSDKDRDLLKRLRQHYKDEKVEIIQLDIEEGPGKGNLGAFSSVFSINVLEHIKDQEKALINMGKLLTSGGSLTLLVPAKKKAYTKLDRSLGHYRRYEKAELQQLVEEAGFTVEKLQFFNFVGLLSWVIRDRVEKSNFHLKPYQIRMFDAVVPLLRVVEGIVPVPVGISLIVVARKKE